MTSNQLRDFQEHSTSIQGLLGSKLINCGKSFSLCLKFARALLGRSSICSEEFERRYIGTTRLRLGTFREFAVGIDSRTLKVKE